MTISSAWVAFLLAALFTYGIVRWKTDKSSADLYGDAIFYFIIVWKLSVVITDFKVVVKSPLTILYFNGGTVGLFLGITAAAIMVVYAFYKKNLSLNVLSGLLIATVVTQAFYQIFMSIFNDGPLWSQTVTVILLGMTILFYSLNAKNTMSLFILLLLLFSGIMLFISSIQPAGILQISFYIAIYSNFLLAFIKWLLDKKVVEGLH